VREDGGTEKKRGLRGPKAHMDPGLYRDAMSRFAGNVQLVEEQPQPPRRSPKGTSRGGITITAACSVIRKPGNGGSSASTTAMRKNED